MRWEGLAGARKAGRHGRQDGQEGLGKREGVWAQRLEDSVEGFLLLGGVYDFWFGQAVAAQVVAIIEAADFLNGGFSLIAVEEVEGHESFLELSHGRAGLDGGLSEVFERGGANGEYAVEFGRGVGAVIPEMGEGTGGAERACIFVGEKDLAYLVGVSEDFVEC